MKTVSYRVFAQALAKLQREIGKDRRIQIYEMDLFPGEPIRLGVNWSAIGTVPADEAREFARQLLAAATAAENFEYNGYTINYDED